MAKPRADRHNVEILKHHRQSDVYIDGRYLVVNMKISLKSRKGRQIALETAEEILAQTSKNRTYPEPAPFPDEAS